MKPKIFVVLGVAFLAALMIAGPLVSQEKEKEKADVDSVRAMALGARAGRSWLGVGLRDITPEKARELKAPGEYGAVVTRVEADSPAGKAGLAKDDVIVEFAGERVWSVAQLQRLVRETPPGRTVTLQVSRGGQKKALDVKLESAREPFWFARHIPEPPLPPNIEIPEFALHVRPGGAVLGISADEVTRQLADYFGVKQGKGVLVREVTTGSTAEKAGLKAGDVIVSVDGKEVGNVRELRRALPRNLEEKRTVTLTIVRDRREQNVAVELEPRPDHLRHAEVWVDELDPGELEDLAAETEENTAAVRQRAEELQRHLQDKSQHWQQKLAAQAQQQATEVQRRAAELQRHLQEQTQRWQQEWQRQWQQRQRELEQQIRREIEQRRKSKEPTTV